MRITNKSLVAFFFIVFLCFSGGAISYHAMANPDTPGAFVLGASLKDTVRIEAEADFKIVLKSNTTLSGFDLFNESKDQIKFGKPGFVRVTGANAEVVIDIEKSFLESEVASGLIKIYDFDLNESGNGNLINILPDASKNSFFVLIGAKVDVPLGVQEEYFGNNVLSVNYL